MPDDIVLLTVDSLRADHCGWLGGGGDLTPFTDDLVDDSLAFSSAIAPGPRTFSSVPPTMTGVPHAIANREIAHDDDDARIERMTEHMTSTVTLAERLREAGYTTVAFTANPWTSRDVQFDRGFDEFTEVGREGGEIFDVFRGTVLGQPARLFDLWLHKDRWFSQWRTFYDDVIDAVDRIDGPVFAWVFLLDTHNPYFVPRRDRVESSTFGMYSGLYRANSIMGQATDRSYIRDSVSEKTIARLKMAYRDSVRSVDRCVEQFTTDLEDAVLVVHSDHGEAFGEHGTYGHQSALYEENVHVPLLVHGTDVTGVVDDPISLTSVPEIVLSVARDDPIDVDAVTTDYAVSRTLDDAAFALRGRRWKYVHDDEDGDRLFDLQADPGERVDVAAEHEDVLEDLRERRTAILDALPTEREVSVDTDDKGEMKEHLRSLGYVGD